jgi:hypothetical protein
MRSDLEQFILLIGAGSDTGTAPDDTRLTANPDRDRIISPVLQYQTVDLNASLTLGASLTSLVRNKNGFFNGEVAVGKETIHFILRTASWNDNILSAADRLPQIKHNHVLAALLAARTAYAMQTITISPGGELKGDSGSTDKNYILVNDALSTYYNRLVIDESGGGIRFQSSSGLFVQQTAKFYGYKINSIGLILTSTPQSKQS